MKFKAIISILFLFFLDIQPASAQFLNPSDAAVVAKLGDILRTHREHLVEAIRTARGMERTFETLKNLNEYEKTLRRDINFISSLDLSRLDDLERIVLYGDQTDFYFRTLTSKINRDLYNSRQMGRYGEGFLASMDGLGLDANMLRAIYDNEQSLKEAGITPEEANALVKELSVESTMLDLYEIRGTENLIKALTEQGEYLKNVAADSSVKLDQGQRVMLLTKSEESLIEALKYQQQLAEQLKERNEKISRKLMLKSEMESEIKQLEKFYEWHASFERNLGFFDTEYIKRQQFK